MPHPLLAEFPWIAELLWTSADCPRMSTDAPDHSSGISADHPRVSTGVTRPPENTLMIDLGHPRTSRDDWQIFSMTLPSKHTLDRYLGYLRTFREDLQIFKITPPYADNNGLVMTTLEVYHRHPSCALPLTFLCPSFGLPLSLLYTCSNLKPYLYYAWL